METQAKHRWFPGSIVSSFVTVPPDRELVRTASWLELHPDIPKLQVRFPVGAQARANQ